MSHTLFAYSQIKALNFTNQKIPHDKIRADLNSLIKTLPSYENEIYFRENCWSDCLQQIEKSLFDIVSKIEAGLGYQSISTKHQKEAFQALVLNLVEKIFNNINYKIEHLKILLLSRESISSSEALINYDHEPVYWQNRHVTRAQFLKSAHSFLSEQLDQLEKIFKKGFPIRSYTTSSFSKERLDFYSKLPISHTTPENAERTIEKLREKLFHLEGLLPLKKRRWKELVQQIFTTFSHINPRDPIFFSGSGNVSRSRKTQTKASKIFSKRHGERVPGTRPRRRVSPRGHFTYWN